ncbi:MAG TPA: alpha/beta fold hydrolase [Thermoleophilaceae bacterium]|nr:alpha/beta fold hydrolase [Thermoleophilaceae bacterium]
MEVAERQEAVAGMVIHWREAPAKGREPAAVGPAPILYLHGVPTASWLWRPFLERTGGVAPDLPGFGQSAKPAYFDYSVAGYDRFLEQFTEAVGLERMSLVLHDWGSVGLAFAQRFPERIERLVMFSTVPFLPGFRWHRVARGWRTPIVGELMMGFATRWAFRREMPREVADTAWEDFDHGTQRAILKLYRAAPEEELARAGGRLGDLRCPALILWPTGDPYIPADFGRRYADALGGQPQLEPVEGGHWTWFERPELVARAAEFLG